MNMSMWRSFTYAFSLRPLAVAIPVMMIPVGIAAMILGEGASRAFTLIPGGSLFAHLLGALLAIGGTVTVAGMVRLGTLVELLGLVLIAAGSFIYTAGVIIGLGTNGIIAGGAFAAITVGCVGRVFLLASFAHQIDAGRRRGEP